MRIIAGAYKGLKLYTDKKSPVRPTDDFTREMLFNILQPIKPGALVLDLYGGTGAVALRQDPPGRVSDPATVAAQAPTAARHPA